MIRSEPGSESQAEDMLAAPSVAHALPDQAGPIADEVSDSQLVWRMRGQDEEALGLLYDRHGGIAYGLALRMLRDRASAEEVVQDAFVSIWRSAGAYAPDRASVRTWLLTIVRRRAIDRLRHVASKEQAAPIEGGPELVAGSDTWRQASEAIRADAVRSALGDLPSDQLKVLEMAYFGGLSQTEIADASGVPVGTVKSRTRLGLARLKSLLADTAAAEDPEL